MLNGSNCEQFVDHYRDVVDDLPDGCQSQEDGWQKIPILSMLRYSKYTTDTF